MDDSKKAAFVRMGRRKFSKGGLIKRVGDRKYLAGGGSLGASFQDPNGSNWQNQTDTSLGGPTAQNTNAVNPNTGFLGTIGGALGLNNNYTATGAPIQSGTNTAQLNQAYGASQNALGVQGNLVNTLSPQAQSAVGNQNALANQYLQMSQGQGPNPALAQLDQTTGQNVSNQAALMAGQRGASSNVGLLARQAAQQGAQTQQQAVGQGATLAAQQQIAAQQNLANLSNNQISQTGQSVNGLNSAQQNQQALLQNSNTSYNNALTGMQSNINNVNAQTAGANQNMASNLFGGITSAASSVLGGLFAKGGAVVGDHLTLAEMNAHSLMHKNKYAEGGEVAPEAPSEGEAPDLGDFKSSAGSADAPNIASTSTLPASNVNFAKDSGGGGGGGGASGLLSMLAMADGGSVQPNLGSASYNQVQASGGPNIQATAALPADKTDLSKSAKQDKKLKPTETVGEAGPWETGGGLAGESDLDPSVAMAAHGGMMDDHQQRFHEYFSEGGKVPAMVSPGEIYLSPDKVQKVLEGHDPMKIGQKIPGKPKVKGDSLKNDTVPMTLQEGGVVIPRHIATHKMSKDKAALFVHRAMAKKKVGG